VRRRLVKQRTALTNQIHGLLHEYGIALARGRASVRCAAPCPHLDDACSRRINARRARRRVKIAAVAVANKNARIAWALLAKGRSYCAVT
jgi:hypothetical protein